MYLSEESVVESVKDLAEYYGVTKNGNSLYIGIEWERSGVFRSDLSPVVYGGDVGYLAILKKLVAEAGWTIVDGHRNYIFELQRGGARVTLEADGRLELSGSPKENLYDLTREFRIHANEVKEVSDFFNIAWIPLGFQPFHTNAEIQFIKKDRYLNFLNFGVKPWMETTMKKNNGLTVNFSYSSEENAVKKAKIAFLISPIIGAMFATSPFNNGKISEFLDLRRYCISMFDPERNSIPLNILDDDFCFEDWINFYIKFPVYLIKTKGKKDVVPKDLTFERWISEGYHGRFPTIKDFDQHVKTTWSDIRLRPDYIEYRVADSNPIGMAMGIPALIKGLVFDSGSWDSVEKLTKDWSYEDVLSANNLALKNGLSAEVKGKTLLWYASELLQISEDALKRFSRTQAGDDVDEGVFLEPVKKQILGKKKSIASELKELWTTDWGEKPSKIVQWCDDAGTNGFKNI